MHETARETETTTTRLIQHVDLISMSIQLLYYTHLTLSCFCLFEALDSANARDLLSAESRKRRHQQEIANGRSAAEGPSGIKKKRTRSTKKPESDLNMAPNKQTPLKTNFGKRGSPLEPATATATATGGTGTATASAPKPSSASKSAAKSTNQATKKTKSAKEKASSSQKKPSSSATVSHPLVSPPPIKGNGPKIQMLRAEYDALVVDSSNLVDANREIDKCNKWLKEKQETIDELKVDLSEAEDELEKLEKDNKELTESNKRLKEHLVKAQKALKDGGKSVIEEVNDDVAKAIKKWIKQVGFRSQKFAQGRALEQFAEKIYSQVDNELQLSNKEQDYYCPKDDFLRVYESVINKELSDRRQHCQTWGLHVMKSKCMHCVISKQLGLLSVSYTFSNHKHAF